MLKILAIDDNKDNLISLKAIIQDAFQSSSFFTALNGPKGIDAATVIDPDVILLDIIMPDMDGFEVCKILKRDERTRDIPVVFLTANTGSKESRIKALEVGAEAFLSKPIDEIELTAQIKAMVKIKLANQQKRNEKEQLEKLVAERTRELEESQAKTLQLFKELKAENEKYKKAESELRESEEKYRLLHESAGVGIGYYTASGTVISYNKVAALNMNGVPEDFAGKSIYSLFPKENADFYMSRIAEAMYSEIRLEYEDKVELPKGVRWFQSVFTRIQDSNAKVIGVQIISTDITEHKQIESENERIQKLLEDSQRIGKIGGWEINIDTMELNWTKEMYNIHEVDLTFKPKIDHRVNFYTPESLPIIDKAMHDAIEHGGSYEVDLEIITAKGNRRSIKTIGKADLNCRRLFGFFQDESERKHTEEKLIEEQLFNYAIIENLPGIFYLYTYPELQLIKWNKNHETMLGLTADELKSRFSVIWKRPEIKDHVISIMHEVAKNGYGQTETSFFNKDSGSEIPFIMTGVRLDMKDKTFIMGFGIDITDRKKAETALRENEIRLHELVATKDKFFSIIAHDLKSPFNCIAGFSDLLIQQVQEKDYEGIEEYATIIQDSSQRVMNLLMNLLEWSRSKTGRMEYNPEFVELVGLINQAIELLSDAARQKSINLKLETPRNTPVSADRAMISTVLRNLISNAVKFTQPGGEIIISLVQKQKEVTISVIDTGIGIKKELIKKLFKIEESYTTVGTQNEKGTGLGLILCKEFVEKHGGKIWAESEFEKGSKFSFTIPKLR